MKNEKQIVYNKALFILVYKEFRIQRLFFEPMKNEEKTKE